MKIPFLSKKLFLLFAFFCFSFNALLAVDLSIIIYDVGQGKCASVRQQHHFLGIDAGSTRHKGPKEYGWVSARLADMINDSSSAHVFISHGDDDHVNLLPTVVSGLEMAGLRNPAVTFFLGGKKEHYSEDIKGQIKNLMGKGHKVLYASDVPPPEVGGQPGFFSVKVLHATPHDLKNDSSLVIKISFREKSLLFTGDATATSTSTILSADAKSDVFDADHHGSETAGSNSAAWIGKVMPKYGVFSSSKNSHGHPRWSVVNRLCGGDEIYEGVLASLPLHNLTFYSSTVIADTDLQAVFEDEVVKKEHPWYTVSTKRQLFGTMDTGSIEFSIEDSVDAALSHRFTDPLPPPMEVPLP